MIETSLSFHTVLDSVPTCSNRPVQGGGVSNKVPHDNKTFKESLSCVFQFLAWKLPHYRLSQTSLYDAKVLGVRIGRLIENDLS